MQTFFESCKKGNPTIVGKVVFPSTGFSSYNLSAHLDEKATTSDLIEGRTTLVVQGCFLYSSFNAVRHTYFCYFYNVKRSKIANLNICPIGHFAD